MGTPEAWPRIELERYHAHHAGNIVSLGGGRALVDVLGFRFSGRPAWWMYRVVYLLKLVGLKNKLRVLLALVLHRFLEPDVSSDRVVGGCPPDRRDGA